MTSAAASAQAAATSAREARSEAEREEGEGEAEEGAEAATTAARRGSIVVESSDREKTIRTPSVGLLSSFDFDREGWSRYAARAWRQGRCGEGRSDDAVEAIAEEEKRKEQMKRGRESERGREI